jgi:hypothetical protein
MEHFKRIDGDTSVANLFENINTSWSRVKNGERVGTLIDAALKELDHNQPSAILDELIQIRKEIRKIDNEYWKELKLKQVDELIMTCSGLYLEVSADDKVASRSDSLELEVYMISRATNNVKINKVSIAQKDTLVGTQLDINKVSKFETTIVVPEKTPYSSPYWLIGENRKFPNRFKVDDQLMVGIAENQPSLLAVFELQIDEEIISYNVPVTYKDVDPVKGEVVQPLAILPEVVVKIEEDSYLFISESEKTIDVSVTSFKDSKDLKLRINTPENWTCEPQLVNIKSLKGNTPQLFQITLSPPKNFLKEGSSQFISVSVIKDDIVYDQSLTYIWLRLEVS